ncbi:hypothetical protein K505DRAFT_417500 [Melanomma pulvis-pyrius CBS 109.77]|uniref:Mid2 domain-containing protein n=1 Tax=Melanomma pulvis-pyrius CBS 109.77 TaxID=1314802 RepID=A0A6A6XD87_9PLEO|nr:hypothetical protein K505DRAFT_417500 [Melanomma pulvis-pyrius CBS 109.77]
MLQLMTLAWCIITSFLVLGAFAHPAHNQAELRKAGDAQSDSGQARPQSFSLPLAKSTLTLSPSTSEPTVTFAPSTWALELKRQNAESYTTCIPLEAYEKCTQSCTSDPLATTCSLTASSFCHENHYVYVGDITSTQYGCGAIPTTETIYLTPTISTTTTTARVSSKSSAPPGTSTGTPAPTASSSPLLPPLNAGSVIPTDFGTGGIVGVTIGAVLIIALLAFWARSRRIRKKQRNAAATLPLGGSSSDTTVSPAEKQNVVTAGTSPANAEPAGAGTGVSTTKKEVKRTVKHSTIF